MNSNRKPAVLISGGSGLIGKYLTSALLSGGFDVKHLSRKANQFGKVRVFRWDPDKRIIDPVVFEGIDYIVHLSGANIGESRWTSERKKELKSSRVDSALLLFDSVNKNNFPVKAFISASGVGYYGSITSEKIFTEEDPPAEDFTGQLCRKWEEAADMFSLSGIRTVKVRTAVVLEKNDSAVKKIMMPARFGFLEKTGTGKQYMPWIHIDDICGIYLKAITDESMNGAYNASSPQHTDHSGFIDTLSSVIHKPVSPLALPGFMLKMIYGEMAEIVLQGSRVSSEKIRNAGYEFKFADLHSALNDVFRKR